MLVLSERINKIFAKILKEHKIENYTIEKQTASNAGDGFIGQISRYIVTGTRNNDKNVTIKFICKQPYDDHSQRAKFNAMLCFEREVIFYNHVLPEFQKIQQEYGIFDSDIGFYSFPLCFHAEYDPDNDFAILILEDLSCQGYKMHGTPDNAVQDVNQIRFLFRELGKFNAISFALRHHKPEIFEKFKSLDMILSRVLTTEEMAPISVRHTNLAFEAVDANDIEKINLLKSVQPCLWSEMRRIVDAKLSEPYNVVCHGDCWINNIMCSYEVTSFFFHL